MLKLRLEGNGANSETIEFKITEYPVLIGRNDTDLLFEDVNMSPIHAAVWVDKKEDKIVVRDLSFSSKTKVNGVEIAPHQNTLADEGSVINMGSTIFKVVS